MQPAKTLIRIQHGSHLYGTSTPSSDSDFKGVHVPAGEDILLQRPDHVIDARIKISNSVKNTAEDTDDQSYSLRRFLTMIADGETVASEILFAPDDKVLECDPMWRMVRPLALRMLNRKCEGYVSYCQRQAAKYGVKGSRMAAVEGIVDLFDRAIALTPGLEDARLSTMENDIRDYAEAAEHCSIVAVEVKGVLVPHLEVCDRKFNFNVRIKEARKVYKSVYEGYGHRAIAAKTNDGIDWKAVSHAIRVAGQAIELLKTGNITFPRPNADYLLAVKKGERDFESEVRPVLEALVEDVARAAARSKLPAETDPALVDEVLLALHRLQVVDAV